jgi:hypothetical protein
MVAGSSPRETFASEPCRRPAPAPVRSPPGAARRSGRGSIAGAGASRSGRGPTQLGVQTVGKAPAVEKTPRLVEFTAAPAARWRESRGSGRGSRALEGQAVGGAAGSGGARSAQRWREGLASALLWPAQARTRGRLTAHVPMPRASSTGSCITRNGGQPPARWNALHTGVSRAPTGGARPSGGRARRPTRRFHLAAERAERAPISQVPSHAVEKTPRLVELMPAPAARWKKSRGWLSSLPRLRRGGTRGAVPSWHRFPLGNTPSQHSKQATPNKHSKQALQTSTPNKRSRR